MKALRASELWQKVRHRTHKEKIMPDGSAPQTRPADPTIRKLGYTSDDGAGARARIGLLVLESDQTMEDEARALTALDGVALYHARLANDVVVTPESLAKMEQELPIAAGLIPAYMGLNAIGYGCTSGSNGPERHRLWLHIRFDHHRRTTRSGNHERGAPGHSDQ